jgi:hypothetical protein
VAAPAAKPTSAAAIVPPTSEPSPVEPATPSDNDTIELATESITVEAPAATSTPTATEPPVMATAGFLSPTNIRTRQPHLMIRFTIFALLALPALACHLAGLDNLALTLACLAAFELLALEQAAATVELPCYGR